MDPLKLGYEQGRPPVYSRWLWRALGLSVALLAIGISYIAWNISREVFAERRQVQQFEQKTSEAKMLGKTADQVIAVMGRPDGEETFSDGGRDLIYRGPYDVACRFEIRGGVVTNVVRWQK